MTEPCGGRPPSARRVGQLRYDRNIIFYSNCEVVVGRTAGAKNRTPRELRAEAKRLTEKANLLEKMEKLKKAAEKKR